MPILREINETISRGTVSTPSAIATLGWAARAKAIASKSYFANAEQFLIENRAPGQAMTILKAGVGAGSTLDSDLGDHGIAIGQWTDSARTKSAFYRILADGAFVRTPLNTRVGITTVPVTSVVVGEGDAVPLSKLTLQNVLLEPVKASALMVVTNELLADVSAAGQQLFNRALMGAVSDAVDAAFLDLIVSTGTTANASTGDTAADAWADLRAAMLAVSAIGSARLYMLCAPDVATRAATLASSAGTQVFVAASPSGGELVNVPLLVSSGVPAGSLYVINAAGIAADGGPVSVDVSTQADVLMADPAPMTSATPTPATMTSMFQTDSTALRASAWFGAQVLRDDAVSLISSISWGG